MAMTKSAILEADVWAKLSGQEPVLSPKTHGNISSLVGSVQF